MLDVLLDQGSANGIRSDVSQIAYSQLTTYAQHQVLGLYFGSVDRSRCSRRSIHPGHSVEPLARSTSHPPLNSQKAHAELASHLTHGASLTDGFNHVPASLLDTVL